MEDRTQIGIFVGIGCLTMASLVLMIIAIFTTHRKKMLEKEAKLQQVEAEKKIELFKTAGEAEEKQKEKIAKNLHDDIIPTLSAVIRSADKNNKDFKNNHYDFERMAKDIKAMEQIVNDIRGISHDLIPGTLLNYGLIEALGYYMEQISDTGSSLADFEDKTSFGGELPFLKPDQLTIYRICLEILNNLYKHAAYSYLKVTVENTNNALVIDFMHDGKGLTNADVLQLSTQHSGLGLRSIQSRVLILNAAISYSVEGDAACINLNVPFKS